MKFEELNLHPEVLKGIANAGFIDCTEVQAKVCPISLKGRDIMARSKTGSGKTAVFLITILERLMQEREKGRSPKALIISPTRELALQISQDAEVLCSGMNNVHVQCFYGGVGYEDQKEALNKGVDIYVGTPGRLIDFMRSHQIDFRNFSSFVIDEADRMFDMGFYPDVKQIFSALPDKTERQTMMFSATLSTKVRNLAWDFMNNPEEIELEPEEVTVAEITQELYHTTKAEKFKLLLLLLQRENPSAVLIFANTKYMTVDVSERLKLNGYTTACLMGDMPQQKRLEALRKMKDGKIKVLVATDVAARGLQIDDLPLVVNYDIPEDFECYVHRVGRTARAGKKGKAITLADEEYVWGLEPIENYIHMKLPVMWVDGIETVEDLSAGKKIYNKEHLAGVTSSRRPMRQSNRRDVKKPYPKRERTFEKGKETRKPYRDDLDDSKLSKMSSTQRLAYYKEAYFKDENPQRKPRPQQAANKTVKKPQQAVSKTVKKPQQTASKINKKPQAPEVKKEEPKKTGLKGFFHKLFGKKEK